MSDIQKLTDAIIQFRDERDWEKFHTAKDLLLSMMIEAGELGEHIIYDRSNKEYQETHKDIIADEFADTFHMMLLLAYQLDIDIINACEKKLEKTKLKYPIEECKGITTKYSKLDN